MFGRAGRSRQIEVEKVQVAAVAERHDGAHVVPGILPGLPGEHLYA